jgi:glycine oxidase
MPANCSQRRVVVVGGGIVGCATAYLLARAGLNVTLLERDMIGAHASGHNAGNLNPLYRTPPALVPSALEAFALHRKILAELTQLGCANYVALPAQRIHLGHDETDRQELEETAALFASTPEFSSTWLDRNDLLRIEPRLARDFDFGVMTSGNLTVDGAYLTRSIAEGAVRLNAIILRGAASGIVTLGARVTGIRTRRDIVPCDDVVFATGPWVTDMKSWLGIDVAVEPVKGELLLLRLTDGAPSHDFAWRSAALYRRRGDQVWVGGSMERRGFDSAPSTEVKEFLMDGASRIMPTIRHATLLEHVAALRPMTASNTPITHLAEGWQNVYIANGGGTKGVLLSVGMAKKIRELLLGPHDAFKEGSTQIEARRAAPLP